ncbi:hypothetical protein BKA56DRAFT_619157 [Ilyonectria sp. MPI-CAGE-AT-0026]|nr:hypothetical protein BKA56DRAFT_619157 [Ilyonectria sp. MPI-CAGE-AT-0026]
MTQATMLRSWLPYLVPQTKGQETIRIPGSRLDFSLVKTWLQYCAKHHTKTCDAAGDRAGLDAIASFKLIDCKTGHIIPARGQQYVALSYVWGDGPLAMPATTQLATTQLPKEVPGTMRDAITGTSTKCKNRQASSDIVNVRSSCVHCGINVENTCLDLSGRASIEKTGSIHGSAGLL